MSVLLPLDQKETIPNMKAVRRQDTGQVSSTEKVALLQVPPRIALPQVPPRGRITPRTDPSQAVLRPVQLRHVGSISIADIPTEQMPAIVLQEETIKRQKKGWRGLVVRTMVTVLLFAFLLRSMSWSTLVPTLMHVSHTYLLIGFATGVLCIFFSAYGWYSVVIAENIKADLARLIDLYLVGIGFSHFLPTSMGGDAIKAFYVGRDSGNMAGAASAALMSRITSFVGMLLIALPGVVFFHKYFTNQIVIEFLLLSLLLVGAIAGAILTVVLLPRLSIRFLKGAWTRKPMFTKFLEVGNALNGSIRRPRSMVAATLFGMLFWVASFLNYYGYAIALGIHVPLPFYVIAIPFVSIIASLPISINGFGVRESAFVYLFSTIHVPIPTATLLALLMDAQVLLFGLIGGCIYFTMSKKTN